VRDIQELLKEKECAIEQLRREVEALRSVSPLLSDAGPDIPHPVVLCQTSTERASQLGDDLRTIAPLLVDETDEFDPGLRARLVEAAESERNLSRKRTIRHQLRQLAAPLLGAGLQ
jgi:hypothetical protein